MTQRHVDLLMKAVNLKEYDQYLCDQYLCNRIGYITGYYTVRELRDYKYNEIDFRKCTDVIAQNIRENSVPINGDEDAETFYATIFYEQGMTRKEWAETILAPLFLAIEED